MDPEQEVWKRSCKSASKVPPGKIRKECFAFDSGRILFILKVLFASLWALLLPLYVCLGIAANIPGIRFSGRNAAITISFTLLVSLTPLS